MPTTCRALRVAIGTHVLQHIQHKVCISIDLLGLQSICSPIPVQLLSICSHLQLCSSPPAVHLQFF